MLFALLQRLSLRQGLLLGVVLFAAGWAFSLVPAGQGLSSLWAQAGRNVLWALGFFVVAATGYAALRRLLEGRLFDSDVSLSDLSWSDFEGYLAEYYRRRGATVTYRGGSTRDGGVDLVLDEASGRRILQAKHWKMRRVGVVPLRELWGVREDERAQGAVFVTSGTFTADARRFAAGKRLELVDGVQLRRLVAEVKAANAGASAAATSSTPTAKAERCPRCGEGVLTLRVARRGARAGSTFVGCSRYPDCTFTRDA